MPGFVKIYGDKLLDSTVWVGSPANVKILWVTLLALADQEGQVFKSLPGLAHRADLSRQETVDALKFLMAPDPDSQTKEHEGRRVVEIEGGWLLLTYAKHREFRSERQVREAERKRKWREGAGHVPPVPPVDAMRRPEAEAEAEADRRSGERRKPREISEHPSKQSPEPAPTTAKGKSVVVRDHSWVEEMVQHLTKSDWATGRAVKEALVAFNFHRWVNGTTNRQIFSGVREARAAKLIKQYGLVRVLLAIQGQQSHPDFNQQDGRTFRGWDNLFRVEKGLENVEKCSDHAIKRGDVRSVLRALGRLQEERGWTPTEADAELFATIGGSSG